MPAVEDNQKNWDLCRKQYCGKCPSYPEGENEALFCAGRKCSRPVQRNGCDCPECPIWTQYALSSMYYCARK